MEIIDLYNKNKEKLEKTFVRKQDKLLEDEYYLLEQAWILNSENKKFSDIEKVAFEYHAVTALKSLVVDDDLLKDEYEIYIEDLEEVIGSYINSFARPENGGAEYYHNGKKVAVVGAGVLGV